MDKIENTLLADLFQAYYDARKHKRNTINQLRFEMNLEANLYDLYQQIEQRRYAPKTSIAFVVHKPVQREIFAADFSDRVVHHLFFNYVNPLFERTYIEDCYSCRKGKGTHYGVQRLDHHIRSCSNNYTRPCFVLKLDLQGYFMSIDKSILYGIVERTLLKHANRRATNGQKSWKETLDYSVVMYLAQIIIFHDPVQNYLLKGTKADWEGLPASKSLFHSRPGCGLPIGNLTSQLFSNIYLSHFDNYVKRVLKFEHYGRYVDDFYLLHTNKEQLKAIIPTLSAYLTKELRVTIHPKKIYLQCYQNGVLFTGGCLKPHRTYTSNRVKKNMSKRLQELKQDKEVDPNTLRATLNSYLGAMKHYKSYHIRKRIMIKNTWVFKYGCVRHCCSVFKVKRSCYLVS